MEFNPTIRTGGEGIWSLKVKDVKIEGFELELSDFNLDHCYLKFYFDIRTWDTSVDGLIYTDKNFLAGIRHFLVQAGFSELAAFSVTYTEQGMQGSNYVSMEAGRSFIVEWFEISQRAVEVGQA